MLCCAQDQDDRSWKVYDLTDYVEEHPGGLSILNNAGGQGGERGRPLVC